MPASIFFNRKELKNRYQKLFLRIFAQPTSILRCKQAIKRMILLTLGGLV
jgi:hypothetical protein